MISWIAKYINSNVNDELLFLVVVAVFVTAAAVCASLHKYLVKRIDFVAPQIENLNYKNQLNQKLPCKWITMAPWQFAMVESSGMLVINQAKCIMLISAVRDFKCINAILLTMRDMVLKCDHLFNFIVNGFSHHGKTKCAHTQKKERTWKVYIKKSARKNASEATDT